MKKLTILTIMLTMLFASFCLAEGININDVSENLQFSEKEELVLNGVKIELYAHESVDLSELLSDLEETDTAALVKSKIDRRRREIYPDEEIVLEITPMEKDVPKGALLSQNSASDNNFSWFFCTNQSYIGGKTKIIWNAGSTYYSEPASAFIFTLIVNSGSFKVYSRRTKRLIYRATVNAGDPPYLYEEVRYGAGNLAVKTEGSGSAHHMYYFFN